jgi:hypothetical protein
MVMLLFRIILSNSATNFDLSAAVTSGAYDTLSVGTKDTNLLNLYRLLAFRNINASPRSNQTLPWVQVGVSVHPHADPQNGNIERVIYEKPVTGIGRVRHNGL